MKVGDKNTHSASFLEFAALQAARKARNDVEEEIRQDEQRLNAINDDLSKDYGAQHEWLKLKDVCIEKDAGEYVS